MRKISSLHDDLLWPKVSHECGLGEYGPNGKRLSRAEKSPLCRIAQFGADETALDHARLDNRGEGYEHYCGTLASALQGRYETVVAAMFDRYTLTENHPPEGPSDLLMAESVSESIDSHGHFGLNFVRRASDFAAPGSDNVNFVLAIEGMDFVRNLAQVDDLLRRGVRIFGLQYNRENSLAGVESGLTALGQMTVERICKGGAIIDLAHAPPASRRDVLEMAATNRWGSRVAYTHGSTLPDAVPESAARGPNRFLAANEAVRIARLGGIVGLTPTLPFFTSLTNVADRIDALTQAGGMGSVALGTDFGGIWSGNLLPEIQSVDDLWRIGDVLSETHDWRDEQIDAVLRTNATRWLRAVLS